MKWRWFDAAYEALARGLNLEGDGSAALSRVVPEDDSRGVATLDAPAPIALTDPRVVRVGSDTGWAFGDLQWGPEVSVEDVRSVIVSVSGQQVAYLPLDRAYDVVSGVLSIEVPTPAPLLLGNRG